MPSKDFLIVFEKNCACVVKESNINDIIVVLKVKKTFI